MSVQSMLREVLWEKILFSRLNLIGSLHLSLIKPIDTHVMHSLIEYLIRDF